MGMTLTSDIPLKIADRIHGLEVVIKLLAWVYGVSGEQINKLQKGERTRETVVLWHIRTRKSPEYVARVLYVIVPCHQPQPRSRPNVHIGKGFHRFRANSCSAVLKHRVRHRKTEDDWAEGGRGAYVQGVLASRHPGRRGRPTMFGNKTE